MSQENGHSFDPLEVANLPSQDAARRQFAAEVATFPTAERARWEEELELTDRLRDVLPQVEVPVDLQRKLLEIPQNAPAPLTSPSFWTRLSQIKLNAPTAAAMVILTGLLAYFLMAERSPVRPAALEAGIGKTIATIAIQKADTPLAVQSADAETVGKALESAGMDIPILMLKPAEGTLLGGGTCDFGGTKAAFTRWQTAKAAYTLYEFDGKALGAPGIFLATTLTPTELWRDAAHYRVFIFPGTGGKCCWALVMENESADNIFSQYGAAY